VNETGTSGRGRGRGRGRRSGRVNRLPNRPVALQAQTDWIVRPPESFECTSIFENQQHVVDFLLGDRCRLYVDNLQRNLSMKLSLHSMECNEINLFHLLLSSAFDALLEYTNESLNDRGLIPLSYGEFRSFLGTLFLSSVFNTSADQSWTLMGLCTGNRNMTRERFIQVLTNLRGYDVRRRIINAPQSEWIDQRNTLENLHTIEKKIFERSVEFFFDTQYSCVVVDDEMEGSKARDVETKVVSDRKAEGEGPTCDCLCDCYFQIVLGMRLKTVADSQVDNVRKVLDTLPSADDNTHSLLGPIFVCDRGYGKKSIISLLSERNYKVLTIASKIGSDHPMVGSTVVQMYLEKINLSTLCSHDQAPSELSSDYGVLQSNVDEFLEAVEPFTISDDPAILLGPEVVVAEHCCLPTFYAYCCRDIYDKKVEQKLLRFYLYGFPNADYLFKTWVCVPKTGLDGSLKPLFHQNVGRNDGNTTIVEGIIRRHAYPLTTTQRTAEWFLLRGFHLTATMASRIMHSRSELSEEQVLRLLVGSWFSRTRSTEEMRIGSKNEDAILRAFRECSIVTDIFSCGLFESNKFPWLAASPDAIAVIRNPDGEKVLAAVEVKTRVSPQRIADAEGIAARYAARYATNTIVCIIGVNCMEDVMDKEHATQVLIQMVTLNLHYAMYLVGRPGTSNTNGRIIYKVMVYASTAALDEFIRRATATFEPVLSRFYTNDDCSDMLTTLPESLSKNEVKLIKSRWPFFTLARNHVLSNLPYGFPPCSVMKTAVQTLYNSLKGGMDANTQQFASITPPLKTGFEQKYVVRLLLCVVTNAWRAQQLLRQPLDYDRPFSMSGYRKSLVNNCPSLRDFNYRLAMALIDSSTDPFFQNVLVADPNRTRAAAMNDNTPHVMDIGFNRDPETLRVRLNEEVMPKKHRYRGFTTKRNLVELRLTENDDFQHVITKENTKKTHCALCVIGKTMYRCNVCKVALCKTVKDKSHRDKNCFAIWHSSVDLIVEHNRIIRAYRNTGGATKRKGSRRDPPRNTTRHSCSGSDSGSSGEQVDGEGSNENETGWNSETNEKDSSSSEPDEDDREYAQSSSNRIRAHHNTNGALDIAAMANLSYLRKDKKLGKCNVDTNSSASTVTELNSN
jgi:hypothetical protein